MDKIPLETTGEDFQIRFRDCFSVRYIQAAALLCRLGYRIEQTIAGPAEFFPGQALEHEAFVLNSILSTVAFLESTINEFYADASDNAYYYADPRNEELLGTIAERWNNEKNFDRAPVLTKYQRILEIADCRQFDEADPVFADVQVLIGVRNYLMHYKREWVVVRSDENAGDRQETEGEIFGDLLRGRFAPSPLAEENQPFFPNRCLGHGCAEWAVTGSLAFTDEFFGRLGLPAPYDGVKRELLTR